MNRITFTSFVVLLGVLLTSACSEPPKTPTSETTNAVASPSVQRITSAGVVKVFVPPASIEAGGTSDAVVQLTIQDGYHVNANPPTYPYLKATELEVPGAAGITLVKVTYPKALERKFAFAEEKLAVYEGKADLKATLKADKAAKPGEQSIPTRLRIQACDEQVCYPPGMLEFAIPVTIK